MISSFTGCYSLPLSTLKVIVNPLFEVFGFSVFSRAGNDGSGGWIISTFLFLFFFTFARDCDSWRLAIDEGSGPLLSTEKPGLPSPLSVFFVFSGFLASYYSGTLAFISSGTLLSIFGRPCSCLYLSSCFSGAFDCLFLISDIVLLLKSYLATFSITAKSMKELVDLEESYLLGMLWPWE